MSLFIVESLVEHEELNFFRAVGEQVQVNVRITPRVALQRRCATRCACSSAWYSCK
jgi:hypothetical protein